MNFKRGFFHAVMAAVAVVSAAPFSPEPAAARTRVGVLECNIAPGVGLLITSDRPLSCRFQSASGRASYYVGTIRKFGLDLGFSGRQRLVWAVFAPAERGVYGALTGQYVGATADVAIGAGLGGNVLVGGSRRSVALQPISVSTDTGLNIAAGVGDLTLVPAEGFRR
jgi:hypothetical protein